MFVIKPPEKCIDKEKTPYFENCVFFKECRNGINSLFKCPRTYNDDGTWSNQMFDETTKKCIKKQKLAIPGDCRTYKECIAIGPAFSIEYWREASCPISTNFDPITATCVKTSDSNCCKFYLGFNNSHKIWKQKVQRHLCK